jgi:peptide/nickel transport system ATP-binding protein
MVYDMLQRVELSPPEEFSRKYPHMLSGGERQRVAIAREMILRPKLVVADEPVSMLDASIRAGVMDLMLKLKRELQTTYLFITHDLSVARYMSDKILVMYCGKLVEQGPTEKVISNPQHPYTKILLSAVSIPDPSLKRQRVAASGEPMSNVDPPSGCRFSPRCSYVRGVCHKGDPQLVEIGKDHSVACPFAGREE